MKALLYAMMLFMSCVIGNVSEASETMRLKISFEGTEVIIKPEDNSAVKEIIKMLPATLEFSDFAGEEKIAVLPEPISLDGAPRGMKASAGKVFIYAPWGNFGIFYKEHGRSIDQRLIPLGEVEKGLESLALKRGGFKAKVVVFYP